MTSSIPERSSRLASLFYVDNDYVEDGMELDDVPELDNVPDAVGQNDYGQVDVDVEYGEDGMELSAVPDLVGQDDHGLSDGGLDWAPLVHSESSATPTSPSPPLRAPPSPARTSPTPSPPRQLTQTPSPTPVSPTVRAVLEDMGEPAEMSSPPTHDVRDQPFTDQFKLLADLEDSEKIMDGVDP